METVKFNQLSKELKAKVAEAMPQKGQVIYFVSLRPKGRGTTVLPIDRIFDPWADSKKGAHVDIAYIKGQIPPTKDSPARDEFGRIQFRRTDLGRIQITGGNRRDELLFQYMYLTNQNQNNLKKDWYVSGVAGICFKQDEPAKNAQDLLAFKRQVRAAGQIIDETSDDQLRDLALGLDMNWVTQFTNPDEIRVKLLAIADKTPEKVIGMGKDVSLAMKADVKKAKKAGILNYDAALQTWSWPETGDSICVVPPDRKPEDALVTYFLGKGAKTYELVKTLMADKLKKE